MTAADAPRVGDKVRLTIPAGDSTTYSPGEFVVEGPVYQGIRDLFVGGFDIGRRDRTVEILERALPPEPPIGSIVAARDRATSVRMLDGLWYRPGNVLERTWADVVADLGRDLVVLRHGWGLR